MKFRSLHKYFLISVVILIAAICFVSYAPDVDVNELRHRYAYEDSQFMTIDEMPVHYRINGRGPALVLLHGTAASLHAWEAWTKELSNSFTIISLDLPAFGLTGPNDTGDYSIDYYVSFLDRFLKRLNLQNFHLGGNSLGGNIAWNYALKFPMKVNKLILLNASGYPTNKEISLAFKLAKNDIGSTIVRHFTPKSLVRKSLREVYHNDDLVTTPLLERYYDLQLRQGNRQAFIDRARTKGGGSYVRIGEIQNPTLILWGKEDIWIPVENAKRFHEDLPNSNLKIYDEVGHVPMEEIPRKSAMDVKDFLLSK
ncbi:alpha/beta fold hydrolase [Sungkyunkwania multivorans]|uniref:Alpha/beta fold hydrolase n=1 Tax=Sungkyunkwania multivorans TaxID=1173618 RepID=A0ABW3CU87_9FLAO